MMESMALHLYAEDLTPEESWELVEWCRRNGADEFSINCIGSEPDLTRFAEAFEEKLAPFRLGTTYHEVQFVYQEKVSKEKVPLWSLNPESLLLLQTDLPDGIFTYRAEGGAWLEDLELYRDRQLMLGVTTHESEGFLALTPSEQEELDRLGITYRLQSRWESHMNG